MSMRTSTTLPSTHIPGTPASNMSPQMLPQTADTATSTMKQATIRDSRNSNTDRKPSSKPNPSSDRYTGRRTGGRGTSTRKDNRYNSVKPDSRGNISSKLTVISNSLDTGRFGYNSKDSSPISIKSNKVNLFTNPLLPGEFDPNNGDLSLKKLAVNVVNYTGLGFRVSNSDSIALKNFNLIYSKMVSKLANNPSKAYQVTFSDINKVKAYFVVLFRLLVRYYEMESILAWKPQHSEYNITLESLRKIFDNQALLFLKIDVVELLQLYYLPTEFVNMANFMNQTFKTGNTSDSKLFKFMSKDLVSAIQSNNATTYITKVRSELAQLNSPTDDAVNDLLTSYTVAQLSGFLDKDFTFGKVYSTGLPAAANHAVHDLDAYDIFINQYTRYSNANLDYIYPSFANNVDTPYVTHREGDQLTEFAIAFQGVSGDTNSCLETGFMIEDIVTVPNFFSQDRRTNKLAMSVGTNGSIVTTCRLSTRNNMFNDFHYVNLGSTFPFEKVSIPPSHTQIVYQNGKPLKDVSTRSFSNQIFGNL